MTKRWLMLLATIVIAIALTACGGSGTSYDEPAATEPAEPAAAEPAAADAGDAEPTEAMLAALLLADGADGEADHVVAKCPGCNLVMEGSADHAMHVGDYALHFCSDSCLDNFSGDVEASLVAMSAPEAGGDLTPEVEQ